MLGRRSFLRLAAALPAFGAGPALAASTPEARFGMRLGPARAFAPADVAATAARLAGQPYAPPPAVAADWRALSYDEMRAIWFDSRNALFRGTGGAVQAEFFVAGQYAEHKIALNAVEGGAARPIRFDLDRFDRTDWFPPLDGAGTGFAGFRLLGEVAAPGRFQEYAVFQGASYFRAIGSDQIYGLSARGLALDTAGDRAEEFPLFRELWIEAAAPGAATARVHALLDGPSVTGAFSFAIARGAETVMDVTATLYPRRPLDHVGIAAGTSMFLFSDFEGDRFDDFRTGVHDSDGLRIANGAGEVLWRPLGNPVSRRISAFADRAPKGFGLIQRRRAPEDFNDLEARYESRPSLWVEPRGDWGEGHVVLVELPTPSEYNDNIVAYWRPATPLLPGRGHPFAYRLSWGDADRVAGGDDRLAPVVASRSGVRLREPGRHFAIDYGPHAALGDDPAGIEARVFTSLGKIGFSALRPAARPGAFRLDFVLTDAGAGPAELRAELWRGGRAVAETWLYRWEAA